MQVRIKFARATGDMSTELGIGSYGASIKTAAQMRTTAYGQNAAWLKEQNHDDVTLPRGQAAQRY